jgi:hypothetical protein
MGAGAVLINEGYGLGQKLQDLQAVHGLVVPFKPVPKPKPTLTPQQVAENRFKFISTLTTDSPEYATLTGGERDYVFRHTMEQNRKLGGRQFVGVRTRPTSSVTQQNRTQPGLINNG